jgi:nucleotidyltransferase substrate binding protein (TIGR01987 family)
MRKAGAGLQMLDLTSFEKALTSLKVAESEYQKDTGNLFIRDSVIQRYEYTYELCHKMIKRFLLETEFSSQAINEMTFSEIIRTANEKSLLINDITTWSKFRKMRNVTSHTYDSNIAFDVISVIPGFINEAEYLLQKLQEKNGS